MTTDESLVALCPNERVKNLMLFASRFFTLPYFSSLNASAYRASGLYLSQCRGDAERLVEVLGTENHALALNAHQLAWGEVGYEEHVLAYELFWLIELGDARHDGPVDARTVVKGELQQLVGFLHFLASLDMAYPDVKFLKVGEVNGLLHRCSLVCRSGICLLRILLSSRTAALACRACVLARAVR